MTEAVDDALVEQDVIGIHQFPDRQLSRLASRLGHYRSPLA
jgi:hypothetical protein